MRQSNYTRPPAYQDHSAGVAVEGTSQGHTLPLTAGQADAPLTYLRQVSEEGRWLFYYLRGGSCLLLLDRQCYCNHSNLRPRSA